MLVVEDNAADAFLIADELAGDGIAVDVASTLADALARLGMREVEAVILDLSLPDAEQLEALEEVRLRFRGVPVIVLTEHRHLMREALLLGAHAYVRKGDLGHVRLSDVVHRVRARSGRGGAGETTWRLRDPLTGLANRTALLAHLGALVETAGDEAGGVILHVDLDGFRRINAEIGPLGADRVLQDVARRLRTLVRPSDTVARVGGDEYVVLCRGVPTAGEGVVLARRITRALRDATGGPGVSASIGVAVPEPGEEVAALLERAGAAMRAARTSRGHVAVATAPSRAGSVRISGDVVRALEEREVVLHYQPIVDIVRGRVVGIEALARWRHPDHGLLGAADLIGLVDRLDMHPALAAYVVRLAAAEVTQALGPGAAGLDVFVNFDATAFTEDITPAILTALAAADLPPNRLVIELTESRADPGDGRLLAATAMLRDLGVRLAIDDFGAGAASLTRTVDTPFDFLKLDRALVAGVESDARRRAVVIAAVGLARALHATVIAEGIETEAQHRAMRELGCGRGQGFLLGRPRPIHEIADSLVGAGVSA